MKKIGHFFFTFIPFFLVIGVQYLAVFFAMGISGLIENTWYSVSGSADIMAVFQDLTCFWMSQRFNTYVMVIYAIMTILIFGLWYYMRYEGNYLPTPRSVFHPLSFLGIVMLVPGMQYLCTYIIAFTATLFPHWLEVYEELLESSGLDDRITFGLFLYSVLLGPISEELIFRGVTLRQAKKCLPFWAANLMQAILFGAFHMNMLQGVYAFCLGLILGYVCERGGSIYHSILLHMLFNFWATVLSEFFHIGDSVFAFLFWFLFAGAMTAGGLLVFACGIRKCHNRQRASAEVPPSGGAAGTNQEQR